MKLDRSMIGKAVKRKLWGHASELLGITANGEFIWLQGINNYPDTYSNDDDWFIEELSKLPSEIISEQMEGKLINVSSIQVPLDESPHYANLRIDAVIKFLDETLGSK